MPALDASSPGLVAVRPFNPVTYQRDRRARLVRLSAGVCDGSFPPPRPAAELKREPELEPPPVEVQPPPAVPDHITVALIVRAVAVHYGVTPGFIMTRSRKARHVRPRQLAMYLACILTARSLPEIGRHCGGYDHTTVIHARQTVGTKLAAGCPVTTDAVHAVIERLGR